MLIRNLIDPSRPTTTLRFRAMRVASSDPSWSKTMAREELKWQNIDTDDLPADLKKSFDAMVEAEATFKADLEKLLKNEGHMPKDTFLVMSRPR